MKNKILTTIIITLLALTSLHAQNNSIADEWEASPQFAEYIKLKESGDRDSAMKIKREKIRAITLTTMTPFLGFIKEKYRKRFLEKLYALPLSLLDILNTSFFKAQDILKLSDKKEQHNLAKKFYDLIDHINREDAKAVKYVNKIIKHFPKLKNTELMHNLEAMAKASDIEANKTPEQKQKEHEEFMDNENRKQAEENKKQADEDIKQADENRKQADENRKQAKSQKSIDKSQRNIDKWNEIIERLKGL